jgi:hypothetical protein
MYFFREFTLAGGLASYSSNLADAYYQLGLYAGRVLKGGNPAEMPMTQQTDKLELAINLKTARALGITVPLTLQAQADEVIEWTRGDRGSWSLRGGMAVRHAGAAGSPCSSNRLAGGPLRG